MQPSPTILTSVLADKYSSLLLCLPSDCNDHENKEMAFQHARERLTREGTRRTICTEMIGQMRIIAAREKELTSLRLSLTFGARGQGTAQGFLQISASHAAGGRSSCRHHQNVRFDERRANLVTPRSNCQGATPRPLTLLTKFYSRQGTDLCPRIASKQTTEEPSFVALC